MNKDGDEIPEKDTKNDEYRDPTKVQENRKRVAEYGECDI